MPGRDTSDLPTKRRITTRQACDVIGVHAATFNKIRTRADFPRPYKIMPTSKRLVWDLQELLVWLEQQREPAQGGSANVA